MSIMGSVGRWLQRPPLDGRHLADIKINHTAAGAAGAAGAAEWVPDKMEVRHIVFYDK